jgi:hypothetical protein
MTGMMMGRARKTWTLTKLPRLSKYIRRARRSSTTTGFSWCRIGGGATLPGFEDVIQGLKFCAEV